MCGIAGTFGLPDRALAEGMTRRLAHRGPDGEGIAEIGHAVLGSTRLSLLDFEHGRQPLSSSDLAPSRSDPPRSAAARPLTLVYNGEIYNHRQLRSELRRDGCRFHGRCDTEVLLHLLSSRGFAATDQLEGMWAFAASDGDRLVLGRDPFGIKPLCYALTRDRRRLIFASEIKALLVDPELPRTLDEATLFDRATFGWVLGDRTPFTAIREVPPGGLLTVRRLADGELQLESTRHSLPRPIELPDDEDELVDLLTEQLTVSVREQMVADHPVGALLSGGLDSTLLAALMAESTDEPVHTFTIADHEGHPDVAMSREVAALLGTRHHEIILSTRELLSQMPASVLALENLADLSIVELSVTRMRRYVKAVLCGDGADELFAGYVMHREPHRWLELLGRQYNRLVRGGRVPEPAAADALRTLKSLIADGPRGLRGNLYQLYLTDQLANHLRYWDRGSMSGGLELRVPYLNKRSRDLALSLPWSFKIQGDEGKTILRKAASRVLPREIGRRILTRRKQTAPSATLRSKKVLSRYFRRLIPNDQIGELPFDLYCPTPAHRLRLDLFVFLFVGRGGTLPEGFEVRDLYRSRFDELRAAYKLAGEGQASPRPVR